MNGNVYAGKADKSAYPIVLPARGGPPREVRVNRMFSFRLTPHEYAELMRISRRMKVDRAAFVRQAIRGLVSQADRVLEDFDEGRRKIGLADLKWGV